MIPTIKAYKKEGISYQYNIFNNFFITKNNTRYIYFLKQVFLLKAFVSK